MKNISNKFVDHKSSVYGEYVWVILCCGNEKKCDNIVILLYLPPNMTAFIQPIDASLGRYVYVEIMKYLD